MQVWITRTRPEAETTAVVIQNSVAATRWNPTGYRDRPAAQELETGLKTLSTVERATRGIARVLADAPVDFCLPADLARVLGDLLDRVADDLEAWATEATSGAKPPAGRSRPDIGALYHDVVLGARSTDIKPETAAIVDAVAVDANRISDELWVEPEPAASTDRSSWRSLLNP